MSLNFKFINTVRVDLIMESISVFPGRLQFFKKLLNILILRIRKSRSINTFSLITIITTRWCIKTDFRRSILEELLFSSLNKSWYMSQKFTSQTYHFLNYLSVVDYWKFSLHHFHSPWLLHDYELLQHKIFSSFVLLDYPLSMCCL